MYHDFYFINLCILLLHLQALLTSFMPKNGYLKMKIYSVKGLDRKDRRCLVKVTASGICITTEVSDKYKQPQPQFYLPVSDKIQIELHCGLQNIGYFDLPLLSMFEYPLKKHLMTINCITKDTIQNTINPSVFGIVDVSFKFMEDQVIKFDLFVDRLVMEQFNTSELVERELFIECRIKNTLSKTTNRKKMEGVGYQWKEYLHFTLETIPSNVQLLIKDKDMVQDQVLARIELSPQKEGFFAAGQKEGKFEFSDDKRRLILFLSTRFTIPK